MQCFLKDVYASIMNALNEFPDELFSSDPDRAMVAWTLLATVAIPVTVFGYSIVDGRRSSKIQKAHLQASKSAAKAARSTAQQSLVQGLEAAFDYETARRYFNEISSWNEGPLKDLGLRRIRMQASVSLPDNKKSIESSVSLTHEAWKDYQDSFEKRIHENPLEFIRQLTNFLSKYEDKVSNSDYRDIALALFGKKLKFDSDNGKEAIKDLFKRVPGMVEGSLEYSLVWPTDNLSNSISLVVDSLSSVLMWHALSQEKQLEIRLGMSQPIADFLNTQGFRNISNLAIGDSALVLENAVKIVYLAGKSAKIHSNQGGVDHLKMRMIEGIPSLFKDIEFSNIKPLEDEQKNIIKEFWSHGCRLLKEDEPQVWGRMWPEIRIFDGNIKSL